MESNGTGVGWLSPWWFSVTEIPANVVGSGKVVAFTGCESTVFNPVTNSVMICPGATRRAVEFVYPVPESVIPCPNTGTRLTVIAATRAIGTWRI
jgi:hypothetical protein